MRARNRSVVAALLVIAMTTAFAVPASADEPSALLSPAEVVAIAEALASDLGQDDAAPPTTPPTVPAPTPAPVPADDPVATTLSALTAPARTLAQQGQDPDGTITAGRTSTIVAADLGIEVTFSGHEVAEDVTVRIDDLPGALPARTTAVTTGVGLPAGARVLVEPFEVTANAADGGSRTNFPTRSATTPRDGDEQPEIDDVEPGVVLHVPVDPQRASDVDAGTVRLYTRETSEDVWTPVASYLDASTGALYGELDHLSQFVVIGEPADPAPTPRIVLDPDNDIAHTVSPSGRVTELPFNIALATQAAARFAARCRADVLVTRVDPGQTLLSQRVRAGMAASFDPDLTVTVAFDAAAGHPWGVESSGGSKVYPGDGAAAQAAATSLDAQLPGFTGRPSRIVGSSTLPYDDLRALPGAVVHLEALYLDHSYDWPVIQNGMPHVADGVLTGLGMYLEGQGFDCTDPALGGWPALPHSQYSANGPYGKGTGTKPAVPIRPEARGPQATASGRHQQPMSLEISGMVCFIACASGHLGYEFGGDGLYGGLGFGGGIVAGFSPTLAVRSGVDSGWGTTFDCFAAVGPVGVGGSVPISGGSPGVTFSPGAGGGCYFMTSYTWD